MFLHDKSHPDLSAQYPLLSVPINTTSRYSQFPRSQENHVTVEYVFVLVTNRFRVSTLLKVLILAL